MTERDLEIFMAVARCGNMTGAAKELSEFTSEGELIAKKARRVVSAILDIKDEAASIGLGRRGSLRLGFPYSYVRHVLPALLKKYTAL